MKKIEEEIESIAVNENEKWVLGTSFTALDINLAVTLQRLAELGYGNLMNDKPGIKQVWANVQSRPDFQHIFKTPVKINETKRMVESQGGRPSSNDKDMTETSSLPSEDSLENIDIEKITDKSMENESDVTSPEPTSGNDNVDEKMEKKKKKRQRKRQNEDRTWYSLW